MLGGLDNMLRVHVKTLGNENSDDINIVKILSKENNKI